MKTCKGCKQDLPIDQFYNHPATKDRKRGKCISCTLKDTSRWQAFNPDRCKAKVYRYRAKLLEKAKLQ